MRRILLMLGIAGLLVILIVLGSKTLTEPGPQPDDPRGDPADPPQSDPSRDPDFATGEITGTVQRGRSPVAASLALYRLEGEEDVLAAAVGRGPPLRTARAGNTGSFLIDRLPTGRYRLRAIAADGRTGRTVVEVRYVGERRRTVVEIPAGPHVLSGRVVYADGRPFHGLVSAAGVGTELVDAPAVRTAEDGTFAIPGLEPGLVRISCLLPGEFRYVGHYVRMPHEAEHLVVVDRDATVLSGSVLDEADGAPVRDASVRVIGDTPDNQRWVAETRTDARGRFRVTVLPVRRALEVRAEGYSAAKTDVAEEAKDVTIRLGQTARLRGQVQSGKGRQPRPGVTVHCVPVDEWWERGVRTRTDAAGRFTLDAVPNGPVRVFAHGGGWVSPGLGRRPVIREFEPGSEESLTLPVVPAVRVTGRVVDPDGAGRAGVTVQATDLSGGDMFLPDPIGIATGPDGDFTFDTLVPGKTYRVSALPPGLPPATSRPITGEPGETIELTLGIAAAEESSRWLEIRVIERETGDPVPGAVVLVAGRKGRTGEDGLARMGPFRPGRISVWARHPEYVVSKDHPVLEAGSGLVEMTLRLQRGLAVAGRVFLPDGRPLENGSARVMAAVDESGAPADSAAGPVTAGGEFRVGGLLAGRYHLKIGGSAPGGGGFWAETVTEAGVEDLVLTTEEYVSPVPGQALVFRVVDPEGAPVPSGTVDVRFTGEEETWSNDLEIVDGRATMEYWGLVGRITVVAHGARTLSGRRLPLGSARRGPAPLRAGEMEIRLPAEREITGLVKEKGGRAVPGVALSAVPADAEELEFDSKHAMAWSNDRGEFRLGGLCEGPHLISVEPPPGFLPPPPVLSRADSGDLSIELSRGVTVRIRVVGPDGAPLAGARVHMNDPDYEDERDFDGYSRRDGLVVFEGLRPDRPYDTEITPPPDPRPLMPVKRRGQKPADAEVALPAGRMVAGVVVYPDGSPAPGAAVSASSKGGGFHRTETARDGSFRFGPYPAGPVRLRTRTTGPESEPVEVAAGREDVTLTLKAAARLSLRILDWNESYGPVRARLATSAGVRWAIVGKDGTVTFTGLPEGVLRSLWVGPVGDDLYLRRQNFPIPDAMIEASLVRGGHLDGRLVLPPGARDPGVKVSGAGFELPGFVGEGGVFRITGIPEGSCVLVGWARLGRRSIEGHVWTRTGESVTLEIGAR